MRDFDHRLQSTAFTDGPMFTTQPVKHSLQIWQNRKRDINTLSVIALIALIAVIAVIAVIASARKLHLEQNDLKRSRLE
jgi:ABC-type spermidine/putrescine transport system permease subunit II